MKIGLVGINIDPESSEKMIEFAQLADLRRLAGRLLAFPRPGVHGRITGRVSPLRVSPEWESPNRLPSPLLPIPAHELSLSSFSMLIARTVWFAQEL